MKVIDLLNAIAGTGIIPQRIYYNGNVYEYDGETQNYYKSLNFTKDWLIGEDITALLNDEVEIIEEPKKIEKISWRKKESLAGNFTTNEKQEILARRTEKLKSSLNELIDEINKLKEND